MLRFFEASEERLEFRRMQGGKKEYKQLENLRGENIFFKIYFFIYVIEHVKQEIEPPFAQ
jgi:hypothetical protein